MGVHFILRVYWGFTESTMVLRVLAGLAGLTDELLSVLVVSAVQNPEIREVHGVTTALTPPEEQGVSTVTTPEMLRVWKYPQHRTSLYCQVRAVSAVNQSEIMLVHQACAAFSLGNTLRSSQVLGASVVSSTCIYPEHPILPTRYDLVKYWYSAVRVSYLA